MTASASSDPIVSAALPPAGINRKRITIVSVFAVVSALAAALGYMPWEVPAILAVWVGGLWFAALMARRADLERALNVDTVSYCFNAVLLTLVCFNLGGSTWLAGTFYTLLVLVAGAGLPRARAILVAVIAWAGFAVLALGPVVGLIDPPSFGFTDPRSTDMSFAVVTALFQALALGSVVVLQQWLVGSLRHTAHSSRAMVEASTDLVLVLDRAGDIHGSNVELGSSPFGGEAPSAISMNDVVTDSHRGYLQLKLAQAFSGKRVPFELAYRGDPFGERWLSGTLVPLPVENADPRVLLIGRDMTLERALTAETARSLAREATSHRVRTLERSMIDVLVLVDKGLAGVVQRAKVLRARKQSREDAEHADAIAAEAERVRVMAKDVLEWMEAVSGGTARETPPT